MCHNAEFHEISCGHIVISWFCLTGGHLGFLKLDFLTYGAVKSPILYRPAKFRKSNQWEDIAVFRFFQYGGCLPSRIWLMHIWTTHDEYLVVFIAVQNLVGIVAVVIIGKLYILHLWLENAYLCPQKIEVWVISSPKWGLSVSFEPSSMKICRCVWPVPKKCINKWNK